MKFNEIVVFIFLFLSTDSRMNKDCVLYNLWRGHRRSPMKAFRRCAVPRVRAASASNVGAALSPSHEPTPASIAWTYPLILPRSFYTRSYYLLWKKPIPSALSEFICFSDSERKLDHENLLYFIHRSMWCHSRIDFMRYLFKNVYLYDEVWKNWHCNRDNEQLASRRGSSTAACFCNRVVIIVINYSHCCRCK